MSDGGRRDVLAIIGGSGLYEMGWLEGVEEVSVSTPFGLPSDVVLRGHVKGGDATVLFLPRHGRGHRFSPSTINYRANICALKMLGATHVLSVSAVGSMREEIAPGDLVVVDQFIDLTKRRASTFFDDGVVAHIPFADPVCPILATAVHEAALTTTARVHRGGTYVCIEGPQFSTRAESLMYRAFGAHVIGMTNMPEAKLAREAELPYATLALTTDFDCWHVTEEAVNVEAVIAVLNRNIVHARNVARALAHGLPDVSRSPARSALRNAVMTSPGATSPDAQARLEWLLGPRPKAD
ncbi:S-methyl-5'-thioadenosine phosphorylase [Sorangium cellulosum]|uniref:S-methyl-5'-thioadenosine phosphorylase n=1 Tax=Sorangium cellulosum TaxID=56 RepID=A0A4P2Q1A2_SORCE|nr:S-methyl-5'-thioadenosine phosphorylase [Sorangium cellulosum]AUX22994.1 S-methyl-5'-thioadenosine phosphorylase [Sorangium cellulosum]